jgi:hypothetical protein
MPDALSAPASLDPNAPPPASPTPDSGNTGPGAGPPPSPTSEYWGKGILKEDGSFDHTRWDKAPDDIKDVAKDFSKFKNWDEAAKAWKGKNELLGRKGIAEPLPPNATPEQRAEHLALVRKALGAPDKPEGYTFEWPKEIPEAMRDVKSVTEFAKIAHEEGISPAAFQKAVSLEIARQSEAAKANEASIKAMWDGQDKLIREFAAKEGMDFGAAKTLAEKAGMKWGVDKDSPLMQNATVFALLTRLGKAGGEAGLIKGDTTDDNLAAHTPETAQKALEKIRDDKTNADWFAYWNRDPENPSKEKAHPRHDEVVAKAKKLSALANANRPMRTGR